MTIKMKRTWSTEAAMQDMPSVPSGNIPAANRHKVANPLCIPVENFPGLRINEVFLLLEPPTKL
jgi:hypothetical protein